MTKTIIFTIAALTGLLLVPVGAQNVFGPAVPLPQATLLSNPTIDAKAIPDWVDQNFRWYGEGLIAQGELVNAIKYLIENEIMVLDPERANTINQLKEENEKLRMENAELLSDVFNRSDEPLQHTDTADVTLSDSGDNQMAPLGPGNIFVNPGAVITQAITPLTFSSQVIGDLIDSGIATEDDWENAIDQLEVGAIDGTNAYGEYGTTTTFRMDYETSELGTIMVFSISIDKELQSIDAELKILEMWLEIISKEQESSSYDASGRLTSDTTESTVQYRESDFNFILRTLGSIDQQIMALDTGIEVLQEKLDESEAQAQDKASDYTQFVQLSTQLEELQTTSNILKAKHDTQMNSIRNLRVS